AWLNDDQISAVHPFSDLSPLVRPLSCRDRLFYHFALVHHQYFFETGKSDNRAGGHGEHHRRSVRHDFNLGKGSGPESMVTITHIGFDGKHAILLIDRWSNAHHLSFIHARIPFHHHPYFLPGTHSLRRTFGHFSA